MRSSQRVFGVLFRVLPLLLLLRSQAWEIAGSSDARRAAGGCLSGAGRAAAAAALGATLGAVRDGAVRVLYERRPG
jgi:hypothetical protein